MLAGRVASIRLVAMHADQLHILACKLFFYIARIIRSILVAMHADQLSSDTNHCKCNLVELAIDLTVIIPGSLPPWLHGNYSQDTELR